MAMISILSRKVNGTAHFNNDLVLFQLKGMHKKVYDYC